MADTADKLLCEASTLLHAVAARHPLNVETARSLLQRIETYRLGDAVRCKKLDYLGERCGSGKDHSGGCR